MKIVFIRHGEPDKAEVDKRGFIGQGRDLAPLTELGIRQAEEVSANPLLNGGQVIVASPYTRALQTAAIISKIRVWVSRWKLTFMNSFPTRRFRLREKRKTKHYIRTS